MFDFSLEMKTTQQGNPLDAEKCGGAKAVKFVGGTNDFKR